jgi:Ca2+-binding EF-hand superfamily protein
LSCDDLFIRSVVTQRPSYDCARSERLSSQIERQLRSLKAELKRRYDWTLNRAFASIDSIHEGFINFSSLLNFIRLNGYNPTENEVIAIVRRLDCDAD